MNENENENVSRETEEPETQEIDYTQDLQSIKDTLQGLVSPIGTIITQQQYAIDLQEQINSQATLHMTTAYFAFCLVMFEVFRFVKGLFNKTEEN